MMVDDMSQSEYGDWSREDIYQSISRGVSYKPVLKKIGSRHMLVLNNQQTFGSFIGVVHAQDVLPALTRDPLPELANGGVAGGPVFAD